MRLLHAKELRFQEFFDSQIPVYGILSHRWGKDEASYQDLQAVISGAVAGQVQDQRLTGAKFAKIQGFRDKSWTEWVWIDTCCINKESSAELSEAIKSMYRWYANAKVCWVYMSDVLWAGQPVTTTASQQGAGLDLKRFRASKWFSRGWTLQELLAPKVCLTFKSGDSSSSVSLIERFHP